MKEEIEKAVKRMAAKTEGVSDKDEALKYSQSVLNLMNALATLENIPK